MIVLVGPTASGKSDLAIALARALAGEIISADSRQIYRELSAGTAKPSLDRAGRGQGIKHHLIDCADVSERFDAGRYAAAARSAVEDIRSRGRRPILVGGTGLYVRALLEGLTDLPKRDEALRQRLAAQAASGGRAGLHERLRAIDPEAAAAIAPNNLQRVIRALEVYELTGEPISRHWKKGASAGGIAPTAILRIDWPVDVLRERIARRARLMWPGMLEETRSLLGRFSGQEPGFESLGYPEALACVRGELEPQAGLDRLIAATNAYAKRQRTWFRRRPSPAIVIKGGEPDDMAAEALNLIKENPDAVAAS